MCVLASGLGRPLSDLDLSNRKRYTLPAPSPLGGLCLYVRLVHTIGYPGLLRGH